ncbi:hypothetical protein PF008_g11586 [Phytophthora fragariae]|uniref:RxLR effector protein n=1 Tax=Phytophthora fragariae TaxID=53985 RepID=A0A6G0RQA9_9STRA|nr:hypothetical protein PF008_g11586 [Phytophthora fragariae]
MRLTATLLAAAIVLLASNDTLSVTASKATTKQDGLYAELYRVEDGVVADKMRVPLGEVEQYKESDFKGVVSLIKGFGRFVDFFRKTHRRLRIEGA